MTKLQGEEYFKCRQSHMACTRKLQNQTTWKFSTVLLSVWLMKADYRMHYYNVITYQSGGQLQI